MLWFTHEYLSGFSNFDGRALVVFAVSTASSMHSSRMTDPRVWYNWMTTLGRQITTGTSGPEVVQKSCFSAEIRNLLHQARSRGFLQPLGNEAETRKNENYVGALFAEAFGLLKHYRESLTR